MTALINLWRASGTTKKSFCETHKLNIHTFTYWIEKERSLDSGGSFIEIKPQSSGGYVEFVFPQGAVMRLVSEVSMAQISFLKTLLY